MWFFIDRVQHDQIIHGHLHFSSVHVLATHANVTSGQDNFPDFVVTVTVTLGSVVEQLFKMHWLSPVWMEPVAHGSMTANIDGFTSFLMQCL